MLSEYIDKRLNDAQRQAVERHLETCAACSQELASLRMTVQLLHEVPAVPVPRSFAVRRPETERVGAPAAQRLRWLRPATAVAVFVLAMVLAVDLLQLVPGPVAVDRSGGLATPTTQTMLSPGKPPSTIPTGYSQSLVPGVAVTQDGSFYVYDESLVPANVRMKPSGEIRIVTEDGAVNTGISVTGAVIDSDRARAGGFLPQPMTAKAETVPGASPSPSSTVIPGLSAAMGANESSATPSAANISRDVTVRGGAEGAGATGWPARQIEVGLGVVAFGLLTATVYTTWNRRARVRAR